jgi:hypothetical protein
LRHTEQGIGLPIGLRRHDMALGFALGKVVAG